MSWTSLHLAVRYGDLDEVKGLGTSGADIGDQDGMTPLMWAVLRDSHDVAAFLVKEMTADDLAVQDNGEWNVLHWIVERGRPLLHTIQDIVDKCPRVMEQVDNEGRRPIDWARDKHNECPSDEGYREVYNILEQMEKQQQYTAGIAGNVETPCNITITVVGHNGVGKSCFVRQLKHEHIPEGGPGSTDTADFHVNYLGYNPNTGFRQKLDEDGEIETGRQRLKRMIDRYQKEGKADMQASTPDLQTDTPNAVLSTMAASASSPAKTTVQASASTPDIQDDTPTATLPSVAILAVSPQKTGVKQRLKRFFSKFQLKRKTKAAVRHVDIPQERKGVMKKVMEPQMIKEDVQRVEITQEQSNVIEEVMRTEVEDQKGEEVKGFVTIYDFGGEKVFYNTHHCFMSSNMVFVLVFDVAMCLDPARAKDGYERIEFWLRSIATYAIDRAAHGKGTPPVILVGSHLDLVSSDKEEQDELFASVLETLYEKPELCEIMANHVQDIFHIANLNDSTKHQDTYERVWNTIIAIAPLQSQWEKPVPARWVALEHELVRLKNAGGVVLAYDDLSKINSKSAVPLAEHEIMNFLKRMRFSGSFLCFDLHSRRPFIVLQPQWLIHAFKAIITDPKFTGHLSIQQKDQWKEYEQSGILPFDFIRDLWGCHEEQRFLQNEDTIYIAMETLGLLTKPLSVDANDEVGYFIVPSMLRNVNPEIIRPVLDGPDTVTTVTLCLKFDNPFIPQAVWDKMIAACIHRFKQLKEPGHDGLRFIQRGFACLSVDSRWNMIITCSENVMKITMFKKDADNSLPTGTGIDLLDILQFLLHRILELNHQSHLKYQFYLHNDYRFTVNEKMVKIEDLQQTPRLQCHGSNGKKWLCKDDIYIWFKDPNPKTTQTDTRQVEMTKDLPDRNLSFKEIGRVSRYIGSSYLAFFVGLGCPVVLVEQEVEEHRHLAFRSRITKIFIHFLKTKADTGFLAIAEAMSQHGLDPSVIMDILDSNRDIMFKDETLSESWLRNCVSVNDVPIIADHVDIKAYFNMFLELGFSPKTVDEFDDEYRNKTARVKITALLEACIKEIRPHPTVNTILLAMQECDMDTVSLIRALKRS